MCAIVGMLAYKLTDNERADTDHILSRMWSQGHDRGRDGRGYVMLADGKVSSYSSTKRSEVSRPPRVPLNANTASMIGNLRAEPTTEFVAEKRPSDQQPYSLRGWHIVHNGTIANDHDLRTHELDTIIDSAAIAELLAGQPATLDAFIGTIKKLKGSFAILAIHDDDPERMFVAANYRPIWIGRHEHALFFASSRQAFPSYVTPTMLPPYSAAVFGSRGLVAITSLRPRLSAPVRALVVCSGGLDSVVAATFAKKILGYQIELIHFLYGSRAQGPEVEHVKQVAEALDCKLTLFPLNIYSKEDSPLLDPDSKVAGGEAGAEFAHEWVPARNLVLLSVAAAYAEAHGFQKLVLGNNLEEAGAYPDNEPEFVARFNDLLPFAVGDGKQLQVIMPVGNMMKHEIVALGHELEAPMHLTWSCYKAGEKHCGTCGPCYMRRRAFEINNLPEVITYEN